MVLAVLAAIISGLPVPQDRSHFPELFSYHRPAVTMDITAEGASSLPRTSPSSALAVPGSSLGWSLLYLGRKARSAGLQVPLDPKLFRNKFYYRRSSTASSRHASPRIAVAAVVHFFDEFLINGLLVGCACTPHRRRNWKHLPPHAEREPAGTYTLLFGAGIIVVIYLTVFVSLERDGLLLFLLLIPAVAALAFHRWGSGSFDAWHGHRGSGGQSRLSRPRPRLHSGKPTARSLDRSPFGARPQSSPAILTSRAGPLWTA